MGCLLYCLLGSPKNKTPDTPVGIDGQSVFLVSNNGLSAVVSNIAKSIMAPDISGILTYKKVIETFHLEYTVIPMRYGCLLEDESHIIRLLEEHREQYEILLKELEGCVEMGLRILTSDRGTGVAERGLRESCNPQSGTSAKHPTGIHPRSAASGTAYLAARRSYYAQKEEFAKEMNMVLERCCEAFAGLFLKCKKECFPFATPHSPSRNPILSVYFLVPRSSVPTFRQVFRNIPAPESTKLLLSGPWPPYNFVLPEDSGHLHPGEAIGEGTNGA
jgi:hypothetical protein